MQWIVMVAILMALMVLASGLAARGQSRRAGGADASSGKTPAADRLGWRLAVQAYSFNRYTFYEAVEKTASLGLRYIEAYPGQRLSKEKPDACFDHNMSEALRREVKKTLAAAGVTLINYGVVGLSDNEAECRKVFEFAKAMGIETIVSEPPTEAFPLVDKLCNEYGVDVAIHNHPKPSRYWNPDTVLAACEGCGPRVGACADTGHWVRSGIDPVGALRKLKGRIISLHFKDLNERGQGAHDVPWGTGSGRAREMLAELHRQDLKAVFSIEYEHDWTHSLPAMAQCVEFFNQVAEELAAEKKE